MNGEITPTAAALAASLTLQECDDLLTTGMCNIRDAILGYTEHGLTQDQISNRVTSLGFKASVRTIKRHVADLRDEGLLPAVEPSQRPEAVRQRRHRERVTTGQFGPMSQLAQEPQAPTPITHRSEPLEVQRMSGVRELGPDEYTHTDYNKIIQLFEQINDLLHKNEFTDNFSREEWFSLLGSWQSVGNCVRSKCDHIRRLESDRDGTITIDCEQIQ